MDIGNIFIQIFLRPIINLLILFYDVFESVGIPGALGFSILLLTLVVRVLVWPAMTSQLKSAKKMADLRPHLDELKRKHKDDKQALAQAQMNLYKEHGVNPAGGCLPALIQIPIFIALYQAITNVLPGLGGNLDYINSLLYFDWMRLSDYPNPNFFGLNLGIKPSDFGMYGLLLLLVPIVTAALTFVQSKMTLPAPVKPYPSDSAKEVKEKETVEDTMASVQTQMMYLMPLMIGYFSFTFPIGMAFYWNTYTLLGIWQQYHVTGWGGLTDWINRINGNKTQDLANRANNSIITPTSDTKVTVERNYKKQKPNKKRKK